MTLVIHLLWRDMDYIQHFSDFGHFLSTAESGTTEQS